MRVGVVITCHNEREYIADAIASAINQTRRPDRILVVDDGSTDDSFREIRPWGVEMMNMRNHGMAMARNYGRGRLSDCDWIVHLDGDDIHAPTFIQRTLEVSDGHAAVVTHYRLHDDPSTYFAPGRASLDVLLERCELHSCALFRRSALASIGGFRSDLGGDCDWGAWVQIVAAGGTVGYAPDTYYVYRKHAGSLTDTESPADRARHHEIIRGLV